MLKHSVVATGVNDPSKQVSKDAWNNDHVISDGLVIPAETVTNPPIDTVKHFAAKMAGKMMPAVQLNKSEEGFLIQQSFGRGRVSYIIPNMGSAGFSNAGLGSSSQVGTVTAANIIYSGTAKYGNIPRVDVLQSTSSTTNVASWRYSSNCWSINNANGGFYIVARSGVATGASNANSRFYMGIRNNISAPTDVDPSTQTQHIGIGWDSADSNVQLMFNDGSGLSTKIDLGASWQVPVSDRSEIYELQIYSQRGSAVISTMITEIVSGKTVSFDISSNLPTVPLAPVIYTSVGGVSDVTGLTFGLFYSELFA